MTVLQILLGTALLLALATFVISLLGQRRANKSGTGGTRSAEIVTMLLLLLSILLVGTLAWSFLSEFSVTITRSSR